MDAEFYNEASALKLGWTPAWFGCSGFDEELTAAIKDFQILVPIAKSKASQLAVNERQAILYYAYLTFKEE